MLMLKNFKETWNRRTLKEIEKRKNKKKKIKNIKKKKKNEKKKRKKNLINSSQQNWFFQFKKKIKRVKCCLESFMIVLKK